MSNKPIFVATHPRACSTAFERVFMTQRDTLATVHEPFGDAFYYGPERMSSRFEEDEETRVTSGFSKSTYKTIIDRIAREGAEGKRVFIKDIAYYLVPPERQPASIAPSLLPSKRGIGTETNGDTNGHMENGVKAPFPYHTEPENGNPTIIPEELLKQLHFAFLIRNPHSSIPSYYRCTIPPLDKMTGFYEFYLNEAGYDELRILFDYLRTSGQVGPGRAQLEKKHTKGVQEDPVNVDLDAVINGTTNGVAKPNGVTNGTTHIPDICVIDADDLLDDPESIIQAFCANVGIDYNPSMLTWDTPEDQEYAKQTFEKWKGFHEDAIDSEDLKPRQHKKKEKSEAEWDAEWRKKYGEDGWRVIRDTVDKQMEDYLYLKQFAIKL